MPSIYFITGTDTGVGKTVLTALLVRHLRARGIRALAVKPLCSGGREDARILRRAQDNKVTLDEINPWHFRAALAPVLAARRQQIKVSKAAVLKFLQASRARCEILLVEGAGGLLSPLGEGFDARDLIRDLNATPIVLCPNRLGAVNQVRLVLAALPQASARKALIGLSEFARPNQATRTNAALLSEYIAAGRIVAVPRVGWPHALKQRQPPAGFRNALRRWGIKTGTAS